jgi:hypothetical protein
MSCAHAAPDPDAPPAGLDLKRKVAEYSLDAKTQTWAFEDQLIADKRAFVDQMRSKLRASEKAFTEELADSADWKRAKYDFRDKVRKQKQDLRQQIRIHREEMQLKILRFAKEREEAFKSFSSKIEDEMKSYEKDPGYRRAQSDWSEAKSELRQAIQDFKERARDLKPKEDAWQ